jgi:hypothetical protein
MRLITGQRWMRPATTRTPALPACALLLLAFAFEARATGYPVTDSAAIANLADLLKTTRSALETIGSIHKPGSLLGTLKGTQDALGNAGDPMPALRLPSLDIAALAPTSDRWGGAAIDWSSVGSVRDAVRKQLFLPAAAGRSPSAVELQQLAARRAKSVRHAVEDATSLALAARQKAATEAATVETLRARAVQPDLRRSVQANTDALLAVHDRMRDLSLLVSALIELRATRAIDADRPQSPDEPSTDPAR